MPRRHRRSSRRIEFGAPLDQQPLADLDVSFTEFLAPYALPVTTNEYMLAWAAFAFGCHPADLSTLHVLAWVAGFDNHTWAWTTSRPTSSPTERSAWSRPWPVIHSGVVALRPRWRGSFRLTSERSFPRATATPTPPSRGARNAAEHVA